MLRLFFIFFISFSLFAQKTSSYFYAEGASFKCTEARTTAEKAICGAECLDYRLQDMDDLLSGLYKKALEYSKNPESLKIEQKKWLTRRHHMDCDKLLDLYDERIRQLLKDKSLVQHLCNAIFTPKALLKKNSLLGRPPSYIFYNEIPIFETPNFYLNQLLIGYLTQALIAPVEIESATDLAGTECYWVNDDLYLVAFSFGNGTHAYAYHLFLIQVKEETYKIKKLKIPYFDPETKEIRYSEEFIGSISYDSVSQKINMSNFTYLMEGYTKFTYDIKNNEIVLVREEACYTPNSEEHEEALRQGKKEDEDGRIWYSVYDLNKK